MRLYVSYPSISNNDIIISSLPPNIDIRNDMVDMRLYEGACEIKSITKDSTTFSKTVAENMQRTA